MSTALELRAERAVISEFGETLSYGHLASLVQKLTTILHAAGVKRFDRVATYGLSRLQFLISILAVSRLGAATLAIGKIPEEVTLLTADWVIAPHDLGSIATIKFPARFSNMTAEESKFLPPGYAHGDDLAYVVGTSGSTGYRKFVNVTAAHLDRAVADQSALLPGALGSTYLAVPPTTLFGLRMALALLKQGGCLVWDNQNIEKLIHSDVTHIVAAPGTYRDLLKLIGEEGSRPPNLQYCLTSGSKISPQLAAAVRERLCSRLYIQYGITELGPAAIGSSEMLASIPDYAGQLAPWVTAWSVDEHGERMPYGTAGRLVFKLAAPRIVAPYVTVPDGDTADPSLYVSADYGAVTEANVLTIEARETERVNLGGDKTNIHLLKQEMSDAIGAPITFEVVNIRSPNGFDGLVIFVVADQASALQHAEKCMHLYWSSSVLKIVSVNTIPLNEFGKVDYAKLREVAQAMIAERTQAG